MSDFVLFVQTEWDNAVEVHAEPEITILLAFDCEGDIFWELIIGYSAHSFEFIGIGEADHVFIFLEGDLQLGDLRGGKDHRLGKNEEVGLVIADVLLGDGDWVWLRVIGEEGYLDCFVEF